MEKVWERISRLAATFVQDEESPKIYASSHGRHLGRVGVTLITLLALATTAFVLLVLSVPSARIDRHWPESKSSGFGFTSKDIPAFETDSSRLCPCGTMATSWANYMAFFPLARDLETGRITRLEKITDGESFCNASDNFNHSTGNNVGCGLLVNSAVNKDVAQTWFPTAFVLLPTQLNQSLHKKVEANLNEILWNYMISNRDSASWTAQKALHSLWSTALAQFIRNYTSSVNDFWDAAQAANVLNVMSSRRQTALGLEVDWATYANACNPPYCDEVRQNSMLYRFFSIIVQLGGLSTMVLLTVRLVIWPGMRKLFRWPTEVLHQDKIFPSQEQRGGDPKLHSWRSNSTDFYDIDMTD